MAIVAIARRLLVALWHVLTDGVADRHAGPEMVAFKLMAWSWHLTKEERGGLTSRQFGRYGLLRLRLGNDLTHLITGRATCRPIAPPEEVLALFPELALSGGAAIPTTPYRIAPSLRKNGQRWERGDIACCRPIRPEPVKQENFKVPGLDIAIHR